MDGGELDRHNELAAYLRRLVPLALKMHEKAIRKGLIRDEAMPDEKAIERYRRESQGRVAAETIINTQVKVDEASMRRRDGSFMKRLVELVAQAEAEKDMP